MVTSFTLSYPHIFLGYVVAQVQVIFQPITNPISPPLLYVKFFNFSSAHFAVVNDICVVVPVPNLEMLLVCHQLCNDGQPLGDVVPLDDVHQVVQLVPKFSTRVPHNMSCDNSLEISGKFCINLFMDKETFHAILSYQ